MNSVVSNIRQHLSLYLGLQILVVVFMVFGVFLGILFYQTRAYVKREAISNATQVLDSTVHRISGIMDEVEMITASMEPLILSHLEPDSLLACSRLMLERHPEVLGFTIAMEPDFFPERGSRFSAYSLRTRDSIKTIVEDNYDYYERSWYKMPKEQKKGCWPEPYIDEGTGVLTSSEYNYSYCKPLTDRSGQIIGVLCTDLLLKGISQAVTKVEAYPNSSAIMLGHDGRYIVHPDTTKLIRQSIYSDPDPQALQDVTILGDAMLAGHSGIQQMIVDGQNAYVFYRPLERTGWSIAIVCPASDIFHNYNHLLYSVLTVITISLLILLLLCYHSVHRSIVPLNLLAQQTCRLAEGHFEEPLDHSPRRDSVGRLQNSFILMQQSLHEHVSELRQLTAETEQRNQELMRASQMVREADKQKRYFIQDMSHQIRTPLNIINGFAQVLSVDFQNIPDEECNDIISRMRTSAKAISHITRMLNFSSPEKRSQNSVRTTFNVEELCREALSSVLLPSPAVVGMNLHVDVPEDFTIHSDREALLSILTELLDNAVKFTPQGIITLECLRPDDHTVAFAVSDTGIGISSDDRELIFTQFAKVNYFTEGIGLGLPLSRQMAQMLGGDLQLDTSYQGGSRFILTLDL
jgi:signal transduction histidine kinase